MSKIKKVGDLCKKCGTPVILRERDKNKIEKSKIEKTYYYTHFLFCTYCHTVYYTEKYKKHTINLFPKTTAIFGKEIKKEQFNYKKTKRKKKPKKNKQIKQKKQKKIKPFKTDMASFVKNTLHNNK